MNIIKELREDLKDERYPYTTWKCVITAAIPAIIGAIIIRSNTLILLGCLLIVPHIALCIILITLSEQENPMIIPIIKFLFKKKS